MGALASLPRSFYLRPAEVVAPALLGRWLVREGGGRRLVARIVETEAYLGAPDRASHAWNDRRTARTAALFRTGGVAYVYFVYGLHHMLNAVTGSRDDGSAVLLRAASPVTGIEEMRRLRGLASDARPTAVAAGPARLCQAMDVDLRLNGHCFARRGLRITEGAAVATGDVVRGQRIGIDYAGDAAHWPLRFALRNEPCVSLPRP